MLKNIVRLEHIVGDRVYHLLCDNDSPITEVREALNNFLNLMDQIEANVKAQQEQKAAEEASKDPVFEEPKQELVG